MGQLATMFLEAYVGNAQLRTLQRRVKARRAERARELIMGKLHKPVNAQDEAPTEA